jgi:hypothetical protein
LPPCPAECVALFEQGAFSHANSSECLSLESCAPLFHQLGKYIDAKPSSIPLAMSFAFGVSIPLAMICLYCTRRFLRRWGGSKGVYTFGEADTADEVELDETTDEVVTAGL